LPQNAAPEVDLSITRIDEASATIEVAIHAVRVPALSSSGAESDTVPWSALVDSIAIDPDYDGEIFRATLADAPLKKRSTVAGRYVVALPTLPATVAVRVADIAGGERIVMKRVE
jgi:hypothetical protein